MCECTEPIKCNNNKPRTEGIKNDIDKLRFDLLDPWFEDEMVDVLTFGAKKYADDNWKNVDNAYNRYYAALRRHLSAWRGGEELDPESGRPHLAHISCCVYFLRYFERLKEEC